MKFRLIKFCGVSSISGLILGSFMLICASCEIDMECEQGEQRICGSSEVGLCRMGFQLCAEDNHWGECIDAVDPADEICDGKDNDCDGETDQVTTQCNTRCGVEGVATCMDGNWSCSEVSPDEVCGDGIDNDCDGTADEGCNCTNSVACGSDIGECKTGTQYCWDNIWTECKDAIGPTEEKFDCKDNDCDGSTDEDFIGTDCQDKCGLAGVRKCENGIPICEVTEAPLEQICPDDCGVKTCIDGKWTACKGGKPREPEVCDGHDNNCDGLVDNLVEPCKIDCQTGLPCTEGIYCKSGYKTCDSDCNIGPTPVEICNNQDDDCDGLVDEDITAVEICNNKDDDCDGQVDEDITAVEICNNQDDDCDGQVDEDIPETDCATACGEGKITCTNGKSTCSAPPVLPETCNNKDDNCDGITDNAFGGGSLTEKCSVDCGSGLFVDGMKECVEGNWSECKPVLKPCPF